MWTPVVLVFDGDDTLWRNEWQYSEAFTEFFAYLYSEFKYLMPNFDTVKSRYDEIDRELFETWGVRRGRVAQAMLETYHELLVYLGKRYSERKFSRRLISPKRNKRIEAAIRRIGDRPFDLRKLRWLPGAYSLLHSLGLYGVGYWLCLLTSYDEKVWPRKEHRLFTDGMPFDRIRVVPGKKTAEDFIAVSGFGTHPQGMKFYAVGNGPSDILPALEISDEWHGIYIPHGSTSALFQKEKGGDHYIPPPINHPRVITLESIRQLDCVDLSNFRRYYSDRPYHRDSCPYCKPVA